VYGRFNIINCSRLRKGQHTYLQKSFPKHKARKDEKLHVVIQFRANITVFVIQTNKPIHTHILESTFYIEPKSRRARSNDTHRSSVVGKVAEAKKNKKITRNVNVNILHRCSVSNGLKITLSAGLG